MKNLIQHFMAVQASLPASGPGFSALILRDGQPWSYRFGLEQLEHGGRTVVFHGAGLWGFRSLLLRLPEEDLSVIQLANVDTAEPDQDALLAAIAADLGA